MRTNVLRVERKSGEPTFSTHIHSTWPSVVEAIGHAGQYDYIEFVAEYAPYTLHDLDNLCRAAEVVNIDMMIKIDYDTHQFVAQKAIGNGFYLRALCRSSQCRRGAAIAVQSVRPDTLTDGGMHGVGTRRFTYMGYGGTQAYVDHLRDVELMFMIEKKSAVDELEAILDIPGVDMVQWGGSDYSMNIGKPGQRKYCRDQRSGTLRHRDLHQEGGASPAPRSGKPEDAKE